MGKGRATNLQRRELGVVTILFAGALIIIFACCGLALDLSQVFNRKMELQTVADTAALAAARELDGTAEGIGKAQQAAAARFSAVAPTALTYQYSNGRMAWTDAAIEFATTPQGPWLSLPAAVAKAAPNGLLYTKIETDRLDAIYGSVRTRFIAVVAQNLSAVPVGAHAVAGRSGIMVTPLGLCAMRPEARRNRNGELEEYGFRRGVGYDLMQLNPASTAVGKSFLIHPLTVPGGASSPSSDFVTVAPFVCTGSLRSARITGGAIDVSSPFPIGSLYQQLNSRFDAYTAPCSPDSAPPDTNIKQYSYDSAVQWMATAPLGQAAALSTSDGKRWTVAGPDPISLGTTGRDYGPLWSYAKAVRFADPAPAGGYAAYGTADWAALYNPGKPQAGSYPNATPYLGSSSYTKSPSHRGVRDRRVLNVALLACPVGGSRATTLAIGRFFMTVQADSSHLYAEFAGLADEQTLRSQVKLYP
jgi:Flp pilus assembly protein TadG